MGSVQREERGRGQGFVCVAGGRGVGVARTSSATGGRGVGVARALCDRWYLQTMCSLRRWLASAVFF